jgi:hypothetical protein
MKDAVQRYGTVARIGSHYPLCFRVERDSVMTDGRNTSTLIVVQSGEMKAALSSVRLLWRRILPSLTHDDITAGDTSTGHSTRCSTIDSNSSPEMKGWLCYTI